MTGGSAIHIPIPPGLVPEVTLALYEAAAEIVGDTNPDGTPKVPIAQRSEAFHDLYTAMARAAISATLLKLAADGWLVRKPGATG